MMHEPKGSAIGKPLRFAWGPGDAPVERLSNLSNHPGHAFGDPFVKADIEQGAVSFQHANRYGDSCIFELFDPASLMGRVSVDRANDDPSDSRSDDGIGAGRGATVCRAWFESYVERRTCG